MGSGMGLGHTNMMSEADFERANTDVEDNESSDYYEEEVTDEEAMKKAELDRTQDEDDKDSDDSDLGFYMPSVIAKTKKDEPSNKK